MEVDVIVPLVQKVTIKLAGGWMFTQGVKYEFEPKFYGKCETLGHVCLKDKPMVMR